MSIFRSLASFGGMVTISIPLQKASINFTALFKSRDLRVVLSSLVARFLVVWQGPDCGRATERQFEVRPGRWFGSSARMDDLYQSTAPATIPPTTSSAVNQDQQNHRRGHDKQCH
jgi:hypothetical protein